MKVFQWMTIIDTLIKKEEINPVRNDIITIESDKEMLSKPRMVFLDGNEIGIIRLNDGEYKWQQCTAYSFALSNNGYLSSKNLKDILGLVNELNATNKRCDNE